MDLGNHAPVITLDGLENSFLAQKIIDAQSTSIWIIAQKLRSG
jgi:hypothetical protein